MLSGLNGTVTILYRTNNVKNININIFSISVLIIHV
jgi:hypothetical protein